MQKHLIKYCLFLTLLVSDGVAASSFFDKEKLSDKSIERYLKIQKEYFDLVCQPGVEPDFWKLNSNFRGDGYFLPVLPNGDLDKKTVREFIPELKKKAEWIDSQIKKIKKEESFSLLIQKIDEFEKTLERLLELKQAYHEASENLSARKTAVTSKYEIIEFQVRLLAFFERISFLLSYQYPVDHYELRKQYDKFKSSENIQGKRKANRIYFKRMIVQDGAQDPDHSRSDEFLRAMLDTVSLHLSRNENAILSEDMRYDLEASFSMLRSLLARGASQNLIRLQEWRERNKREINFYTSLVANKVEVNGEYETADKMASQKKEARAELRDFNFKKQAKVYHFWREKSELMQALFSIETILYNEVGGLDRKYGLEKKDITQIVLNRKEDDFYSSLDSKDGLFDYLGLSPEKLANYPWLNLMFKEGEFSFTYYFIPSSVRVYCPEMTRSGKWLRKENLKIALEELRSPRPDFNAFRYYSRHSMQGRIRMDKLWSGYEAIPERPGVKIKDNKDLQKSIKLESYQFLYRFTSPQDKAFNVYRIDQNIYVYSPESKVFYTWRNPHYFRYFRRSK